MRSRRVARPLVALSVAFVLAAPTFVARAQEPLKVYAAGSLRAVMNDLGNAWARAGGSPIAPTYGPSGLLRDRLAAGEKADVFASANLEHPRSLAQSGRAGLVSVFARNALCALSNPAAHVSPELLLDRMLDPAIKVGTSTPRADPSGDYAWELFAKADEIRPGARATLETKALKLTGGPDSPAPPADRSVYGQLVAEGRADLFLTYCTNALVAQREVPSLVITSIPPALAVGADYGIAVLAGAVPDAARFVAFVRSDEGRRIVAAHGFTLP